MQTSPGTTLYDRLGQFDGIKAIIEDVVANHLANPVISARFRAIEDLDHARRMAVEFFCAGSGGPQPYTGRDLATAHRGMNVSEQEYMAAMDDILGALEKHGVDPAVQAEVAALLYSMKAQVIRI